MPIHDPSPPSRLQRFVRGPLPVVALLVAHFALGTSAAWQKSMTFDEGVHLTGGFCYWSLGDFRMHPENGNWSQRLAALPLWLTGADYEPQDDVAWGAGLPWEISDQFLFHSGNDLDTMLRRGRAMIGLASVGLGLLVYVWSRRLFGAYGGLVSLVLYAFSPTMLANGFLTTSDLLVSFFFLAAIGSLWMLVHRVSLAGCVVTCLALSGLMMAKFSGVLIVPMAAVLVAVRLSEAVPVRWRIGRPREVRGLASQLAMFTGMALALALGVALVIWASYDFRYSAFAPEVSRQVPRFHVTWETVYDGLPSSVSAALAAAQNHHLLPEAFLFGFGYTLFSGARQAFLDGELIMGGSARFFPSCFAWKTPLSTLVMLVMAAWACRAAPRRAAGAASGDEASRTWWYPLTPLLTLLAIYWVTAVTSSLNIGHRHILPTYPPLFILAGAAGLWFRTLSTRDASAAPAGKKSAQRAASVTALVKTARGIVLLCLGWSAVEAILCWPHYLAYFNVLSGGPDRAYRRLVDSSLDWGQDLKGLKRWLDEHPQEAADPRRVYLSYFGMAHPHYYGIDVQPLPSFRTRWNDGAPPPPLRAGMYCLSATMLQSAYGQYTGPWNATYEQLYQTLRGVFEGAVQNGAGLQACARQAPQLSPDELKMALRSYAELRFGRLCSFLRQREPDEKIGYSILLYRLTDEDLARALAGPAVELRPPPENLP